MDYLPGTDIPYVDFRNYDSTKQSPSSDTEEFPKFSSGKSKKGHKELRSPGNVH